MTTRKFGDQRDWFFSNRFGLFVHWGLYAIPGWHEQHQWRGRVPRETYGQLAKQWNPVLFNADAWLDLMQEAGMSYLCFTTKHHDGFCLWDTQSTDFNVMRTPHGQDILRQLAQACQRRNVPLCLYYSVADWHHPHYPNQGRHHELEAQPEDSPDWEKYLDFLKGQVRELCSNYGPIHGFWWDMNVPQAVDRSINALVRQLQPAAIINNRGMDEGDFGTPERDYEPGMDQIAVFHEPTEACQSVGTESWGFREDESYYTDRHLMRSIAGYLARNANYLLNIGPRPDGTVSEDAAALLRRIGAWFRQTSEAFLDVEPCGELAQSHDVLLTRRGNCLYVIFHRDPIGDSLKLKPIQVAPLRANLLNDGRPIPFAVDLVPSEHVDFVPYLRLKQLPVNELVNTVLVVKLEFEDLSMLSPVNIPECGNDQLIR